MIGKTPGNRPQKKNMALRDPKTKSQPSSVRRHLTQAMGRFNQVIANCCGIHQGLSEKLAQLDLVTWIHLASWIYIYIYARELFSNIKFQTKVEEIDQESDNLIIQPRTRETLRVWKENLKWPLRKHFLLRYLRQNRFSPAE